MSSHLYRISGREPLLFRDGRPFGNELGALTARTLPVPPPSTVSGFLRTLLGGVPAGGWSRDAALRVRGIGVQGPLLSRRLGASGWQPVFPAPADALVLEVDRTPGDALKSHGAPERKLVRLRPVKPAPGAGSNLPEGLWPVEPPSLAKPLTDHRFWPAEHVFRWLAEKSELDPPEPLRGLPVEERVHVAIDSGTQTSREGYLFTTQGLCFASRAREELGSPWQPWDEGKSGPALQEWSLLARVTDAPVSDFTGLGALGGESRLALVEEAKEEEWPACPESLRSHLAKARYVRMLLVTPGIFSGGWCPGWLSSGSPPDTPGLRLKLLGAAVPRREAVSGWDYLERGPKAVRWMAPAGSVFFFGVLDGNTERLAQEAWLSSVSDERQDRLDGFGLALWGVWTPESAEGVLDHE